MLWLYSGSNKHLLSSYCVLDNLLITCQVCKAETIEQTQRKNRMCPTPHIGSESELALDQLPFDTVTVTEIPAAGDTFRSYRLWLP